jgi:hypothetical protein
MEEDGKVQSNLRVLPSPFVVTLLRSKVWKQGPPVNLIWVSFVIGNTPKVQFALFAPPLRIVTLKTSALKVSLNPVNSDVTLVPPFVTEPKTYALDLILSVRGIRNSSSSGAQLLIKSRPNKVAGIQARVIIFIIFMI